MTCPSLWYILSLFSSLFNKRFTTVNCPPTLSTYDLCVYKYFRLLVLWCFVLWVVVGLRERSIYSGWCCVSICQPGAWFTRGPLWSQLYNVLGAHACLLLGGVAGSRPEEPSQDKEATPTSRAMNLGIPRQGSLDKKNDLCWHLLDPYLWAILFFHKSKWVKSYISKNSAFFW